MEAACHGETICVLAIDLASLWGLLAVPFIVAAPVLPALIAIDLVRMARGRPKLGDG